jgi:spore germination cell wall hydrolase CwlJ-like protein
VLARDIYRDLYEDSGPTVGEKFALAGKRLGIALACGALGLGLLDFAGVHSIPGVSSLVQSARVRFAGDSEPLPLRAHAVMSDTVRIALPIARSTPAKTGSSPLDAVAAESRKDVFSMAMTAATLATSSTAVATSRPASTASTTSTPQSPLAAIKSESAAVQPMKTVTPQMPIQPAMQLSDIAARSQASVPPEIQLASLPTQDTSQESTQPAPDSASIVATAVPLIPLDKVPLPRAAPPLSPADRLGLKDKDYSRAERCLANAIYFEARSEPIRGQMAVAQVVINRVFSGFYPNDVCGVVYQNANRHLSCQFTFACDGKSKAITERSHWAVANRIARQTLDGQIYVPEVGKSTHYHAAYVHPNWVHEMRKLVRFGLHSFYRPYAWGNGSDEPVWGPSPSLVKVHRTALR